MSSKKIELDRILTLKKFPLPTSQQITALPNRNSFLGIRHSPRVTGYD
jgi:hypothetical protein